MPETDEDKVRRYTGFLENGIDPKKTLKRLLQLTVAPEIYKSLNTYKYVKRYESSPELSKYAKRVSDKLFGGRKREGSEEHGHHHKKVKKEELNLNAEFAEAMKRGVSSQASSAPRAAVDYSKYKVTKRVGVKPEPVDDHEHGQSSSTSTSASSVKQDHHQKDYAPVRPIGIPAPHLKKTIPQSVSLHADENMFKPRKERQKVFAGRRRKIGEGVPSLVQMCQSVLVANVDMIDHVGIVPYSLLAPALNHASTDQLRRILDANPMLADEADGIFQELVQKKFPKYADREKDGWTWREMYDKLVERRNKKDNAKLDMLTSRIGKAHTGTNLGRQTMMIDMAHTRVKSKSFFNTVKETQIKMTPTPSAIQLSQARKNVKTDGKAKLHAITPKGGGVPSVSRSRTSNNNGMSSGLVVKKTAPLMEKCRKMLKR
ncbi:hypothetical protein CAEBREN_25698 [Caenorhabditis brenneri]|uniref:Uncharacterized protein n=1 Tax=Caenorhabditis brenneri TaxID=135651 RepID=G0NQV2_CAEBE|nr:hypothetical protein CAEBREN_25698 [Caenorhabditis brenneri]